MTTLNETLCNLKRKPQLNDYFERDSLQLEAETADIDLDVSVEGVSLDGVPLDGHYFEHLIDTIDF